MSDQRHDPEAAQRAIAEVQARAPKSFMVTAVFDRPGQEPIRQRIITVGYVGDFDQDHLLRWARSGSEGYLRSLGWTDAQIAGARYEIETSS